MGRITLGVSNSDESSTPTILITPSVIAQAPAAQTSIEADVSSCCGACQCEVKIVEVEKPIVQIQQEVRIVEVPTIVKETQIQIVEVIKEIIVEKEVVKEIKSTEQVIVTKTEIKEITSSVNKTLLISLVVSVLANLILVILK